VLTKAFLSPNRNAALLWLIVAPVPNCNDNLVKYNYIFFVLSLPAVGKYGTEIVRVVREKLIVREKL
jgi:hypothetical protein